MKRFKTSLKSGFTIVELLIVIVVIGILAAISIVAYNGISNKANAATTESDLSNLERKLKAYHAVHDEFPDSIETMVADGFAATDKMTQSTDNSAANSHKSGGVTPVGEYKLVIYSEGLGVFYWDYVEQSWVDMWISYYPEYGWLMGPGSGFIHDGDFGPCRYSTLNECTVTPSA